MKSYCETQQNETFDWNLFLQQKTINEQQHNDACKRAMSWVTCACGQQCHIIPRLEKGDMIKNEFGIKTEVQQHLIGCPVDDELQRLGSQFYTYIYNCMYKNAKQVLRLIEIRSNELITEIKNAQK